MSSLASENSPSFLGVTGIHSDLLVVLLQSSHVLPCLGELSLLHAFSHIPVNKGPLGVHQIKLVVQSGPCFGYSCGVGQHTHSSLHLSKISTRNNSGGLVVDANLEPSGTPVNELNASLGLDGGNSSIHVLG